MYLSKRVRSTIMLLAWVAGDGMLGLGYARDLPSSKPSETNAAAPGDYQSVAFNDEVLVAVSNAGVARSSDNGATWSNNAMPTGSSLIDVAVCPDKTFVALDFYKGIWSSDSDAKHWERQTITGDFTPMAIACSPKGEIWAVGTFSTLARSADRGKTWTIAQAGEDAILTVVQFLSESDALVAGEFGIVMSTNDGGTTWNPLPRVPDEFYPFDAWFKDTKVGWLTGRGGRILSTHDGGATWCDEPNIARMPMYGFAPTSSHGLLAVGELGLVLSRDEKGIWKPLPGTALGGYLRGAAFVASSASLVVVGGSGAKTPAVISLRDR